MNIFMNLWTNWSNYEKVCTLSMYLIILAFLLSGIYLLTKEKRLVIFIFLSLITSAIITVLGILFLVTVLKIIITNIFLIVPLVIIFINTVSCGTCVGYLISNRHKKDFSHVEMIKEYIRDNINITIFTLLLFSSLSVFLSGNLLTLILLILCISLCTIWINYIFLYRLFRQND